VVDKAQAPAQGARGAAHEVARVERKAMDSMPVRRARAARPARRRLPALPVAALLLVGSLRPATARPGDGALASGDEHYAAGRLAEAHAAYAEAVREAPASVTALCRKARAGSELGELQRGDAQRMTWAEAVADAREAVRLGPENGPAHMWLAVALGRQALREGPRTRLALSREIKSEADRALSLDARLAGAWHVLGVWHTRLASLNAVERLVARTALGGLPRGASFEHAEQALRKAVELEPEAVHHRLAYARLLLERKRHADARRELETAIGLPPTSSALDARHHAEVRALLEKLARR
jgi:tetratricopeptide (TPR) repeat protein